MRIRDGLDLKREPERLYQCTCLSGNGLQDFWNFPSVRLKCIFDEEDDQGACAMGSDHQ